MYSHGKTGDYCGADSLAGMSRSVTVAVAYIMSVTSLNWKDALKVVRVGRAVANPNFGFQKQLQDFETFKLAEVLLAFLEHENLRPSVTFCNMPVIFPTYPLPLKLKKNYLLTAIPSAYSTYLQLPSISGGHLQPEDIVPTDYFKKYYFQ